MTKQIVSHAIGFIGAQAAIILAGVVVGLALGWAPDYTADVTVMAQMFFAGLKVREWFI
jgi:hypothetical protein